MTSSTVFTFFAVASLLISVSSSNPIPSATIIKVCSSTMNQNLCFNLFNSNPRVSMSADLKSAALVILDMASSKGSQTSSIIPTLVATTKDLKFKKQYNVCVGAYKKALADIGNAKNALTKSDKTTVNARISAAQAGVRNCVDHFPAAPPEEFSMSSLFVLDTLNIALAVSKNI